MRRADLQQRIHELEHRLNLSALVQMGDNPPEDPEELLREMKNTFSELQTLICRIDQTNAATIIEGEPLYNWLTKRNLVKEQRRVLLQLVNRTVVTPSRMTKSEIRFVSTIKASRLQKEAEDLAATYRRLDLYIQAINWEIELVGEESPEEAKPELLPSDSNCSGA